MMWFCALVLASLAASTAWGECFSNTNAGGGTHSECLDQDKLSGDTKGSVACQFWFAAVCTCWTWVIPALLGYSEKRCLGEGEEFTRIDHRSLDHICRKTMSYTEDSHMISFMSGYGQIITLQENWNICIAQCQYLQCMPSMYLSVKCCLF